MRNVAGILLIWSMFYAVPASASDWLLVSKASAADHAVLVSTTDVQRTVGGVLVWQRVVFAEPRANWNGAFALDSRTQYDCGNNTATILQNVTYDATGKVAAVNTTPIGPMPLPPGKLGHAILKAVCSPDFPNIKDDADFLEFSGDIPHLINILKSF